jgi:hypothetical protein
MHTVDWQTQLLISLVVSTVDATSKEHGVRSALSCKVTRIGYLLTDVSVPPVRPVFESQSVQGLVGCPEMSVNYRSMPRNVPEEPRSDLHRRGSPKLRTARQLSVTTVLMLSLLYGHAQRYQ